MNDDEETIMPFASPEERKLTWQELKSMIEAAGVEADDEIDKIDISWGAIDDFEANKDEDFGWRIIL